MDVVQTRQCPELKMFIKQLEKGINSREIGDNTCVVSASAGCEKVNSAGTDKNLFRLVPVLGHGARVLPLELVPVPGHGAQISAREPTNGFVQTERGLSLRSKYVKRDSKLGTVLVFDLLSVRTTSELRQACNYKKNTRL